MLALRYNIEEINNMKPSKILLPEATVPARKKRAKKRTSNKRVFNKRTLPFVTDQRQRSEAIGLVLLGLSAFSLSLLHYLSSSKISGLINLICVYIGLGAYIIPLMVGLMGIQRFMERPFQNLASRFFGSIGVLIFGLGLLGLEGGKLGTFSFGIFANQFGRIPSKILFFFLFLSSLIFALDILYKDILATGLILAGLTTRFLIFTWEAILHLSAMFVGAIKTTIELFSSIFTKTKEVFNEHRENASILPGKLLSFTRSSAPQNLPDDAEKVIIADKEDTITNDELTEDATIIPVPTMFNENSDNANSLDDEKNENTITNSSVSIQITNFSSLSTMSPDMNFSSSPTPPQELTSEEVNLSSDSEPELQIGVELEDTQQFTETADTSNKETSHTTYDKSAENEEAIYLDDNPIDVEIKTNEFENSNENKNPYSECQLPPLSLLKLPPPRDNAKAKSELSLRSALLLKTLAEFNIKASINAIVEGPAVSRFEIKPAPGVKVSSITRLENDIALALSASSIRIEAPIPGKPALGIEIPNTNPTPVYFYDLLKNEKFITKKARLNLALGITINGKPVFADLTEMPHLLIAGSTGSGKSVCINTIIASILYQARADQVKFIMIDPKMVELSTYNGIPHLIAPVVTDPSQASSALVWAVEEMERRYKLLAGCGVRKIATYNEDLERLRKEYDNELEPMPFIVIVIDELADLMMTASAEVEGSICRLAQMARAVGIHLVIATQRPSVNVLTGLIKANLPSRIAFSVTSVTDSRTILDAKGAESLLGKGDMLFIPKGRNKPIRLQGAFVSDRELMDMTEYVKSQGIPEYLDITPTKSDDEDDEDEIDEEDSSTSSADAKLIAKIVKYLTTQEKTSTSMLQRKFRIGYNRAARIMDTLEERGMVSPLDGSNKRRVLNGRSNS